MSEPLDRMEHSRLGRAALSRLAMMIVVLAALFCFPAGTLA